MWQGKGMWQDNFSSGWMRLSGDNEERERRAFGTSNGETRQTTGKIAQRMCQGKGTWQDNFSSGWMRLSGDNEERERRAFGTSNGETRQTTGKIANRARSYRNEANAAPRMVNPPPIRRNGESGICSIKTSQKILAVTWVQIIRAMVKRAPMWIIP